MKIEIDLPDELATFLALWSEDGDPEYPIETKIIEMIRIHHADYIRLRELTSPDEQI